MSLRWWALLLAFGACSRVPPSAGADRLAVRDELQLWQRAALHPAHIPPPSLGEGPREVEAHGIVARATLLRPEDAPWNTWEGGSARLFNNRAALAFDVEVSAEGTLAWSPDRTTLEVNDARVALRAAPSPEPLLTELLFHAWLEERWSLEGDLSERMRAAGPFRSAWLPSRSDDGRLAGVIAFPLGAHAEDHVVALRLTLGLVVAGEPTEVRLVFE